MSARGSTKNQARDRRREERRDKQAFGRNLAILQIHCLETIIAWVNEEAKAEDAGVLIDIVRIAGKLERNERFMDQFKDAIRDNPAILTKLNAGPRCNQVAGWALRVMRTLRGDQRRQAARNQKQVRKDLWEGHLK